MRKVFFTSVLVWGLMSSAAYAQGAEFLQPSAGVPVELKIVLPEPGHVIPAALPHEAEGFLEIKGDTVYLYYLPSANLRKIEARLRTRYLPIAPQYRALFTSSAYPIENRISARLQFLLMRVEDVLGMKPMIARVDLKVLRSREELQEKSFEITRQREDHKAFYAHGLRTIFSSEQDIIDSIIAHEMAHAVIDHYFMAPPPSKVAELLAGYVDEHLERE